MRLLKHPIMILILPCLMIGIVFPVNHYEALMNINKPLVKTHLAVDRLWYEQDIGPNPTTTVRIKGNIMDPPYDTIKMSATHFYDGTYLGNVSIQDYLRNNDSILPMYYVPNTGIVYPYKEGGSISDYIFRNNEVYWFFGCTLVILVSLYLVYTKKI